MKRILLLTPFYNPFVGGAERFAEEVASRAPSSVCVDVYTARTRRALPKCETIRGVSVYRLGLGCRYDKFLFPFFATAKALFIRYDRTHAVMASYAGAAALFIYWLKRVPYILTLQSGTLGTPAYERIIRFILPFYRAIHLNAYSVHAVSASLRDRALSLGVPRERIVVIPNGINCGIYGFSDVERLPFRTITVARLEKAKGVRYAVLAMEYVVRHFPEAELLVIGDGSERASLAALVAEKKLGSCVKFAGAVPPHDIPRLLASGTVFVCPSLAEGFGIVILEAMASGCAVVASGVGGIPDIVKGGVDGLLVPPTDERAIAAGIERLFGDRVACARIQELGRKRAAGFDWDIVIPRLFFLFRSAKSEHV